MWNRKLTALALVLVMGGVVQTGCQTMAGSAGTGAGIGGIAGGIIGHQSGRGWEGAALGAALGGIAGIIAHDIRDNRTRGQQETIQYYESEHDYEPASQERVLNFEHGHVSPREVRAGERARGVMEYASLGGRTEVVESWSIRGRGRDEVTIQERSVNRQDGTYESMLTFEVPRDLEPGDYTMTFRVRGGGLRASGDTTFTVVN